MFPFFVRSRAWGRARKRGQPQPYRYRPLLEPLEDRTLPATFSFVDLGSVEPYAINNSGDVTGDIYDAATLGFNVSHAFLYSGGVLKDLGTLGGALSSSDGLAIDALGDVMGDSQTSSGANHAFVYSGGVMHDLTPTAAYAVPVAINNSGEVTGNARYPSFDHAFLYSGGVTKDLGTLGGNASVAAALNEAGEVAGFSQTKLGATDAYLYSGGVMHDLGNLGGNVINVTGIDAAGDVLGTSYVPSGFRHAFLYSAGIMHDLGTLGGPSSFSVAINAAGAVTGVASLAANGVTHAFLYSNGVMQDLGTLGDPPGTSTPIAINAADQVTGTATVGGYEHGFLYSGGIMQDLGTLGGNRTHPMAINGAGEVIGRSERVPGAIPPLYAFLYSNGTMQDLLPSDNWTTSTAYAINDTGEIVGWAFASDSSLHGFLLVPVQPITATGTTVNGTEGTPASFLVATFTDKNPNVGLVDFSALIDWGDGSSSVGTVLATTSGGFAVVGPHTYAEEGSYPVSVTISAIGGSSASADSTVNVDDAPLTVSGQPISAAEGISYTGVVASLTDANPGSAGNDLSATIDWGDGSPSTNGQINFLGSSPSGSNFTVNGSHAYAEEGTYQVTVSIQDQGDSTASTTSTANVAVVPPTASIMGPADGVPGQPRTFTFESTDVSPTDQAAGFIYTVNWRDGSPILTIPRTAGNGTGISVDHVFTAPGSYTVLVTATEDGGSSGTAVQSVIVQSVRMQGNSLAVGGTMGNDTIILSPADAAGDINVNLNGVSQGNFLPTDHIFVYAQAGNDTIQLASAIINGATYSVTVPAFLYGGGTGHDVLDATGSTANNVLVGGGGANVLLGGPGRDLLIAGMGASKLHAGVGDAILIGGTSDYDLTSTAMTYDVKLAGLEAIMAEWGRTDADYLTRVHHLDGSLSGGLNGFFFLNATTVHDNGQVDTLFGAPSPSLEWFFAGIADVLKKNRAGEVITSI
jgi:probable HAF family extracellular repeat protein